MRPMRLSPETYGTMRAYEAESCEPPYESTCIHPIHPGLPHVAPKPPMRHLALMRRSM